MFRIALRTFWSDIRTYLQGWGMWVVLVLFTALIGVLPVVEDADDSLWCSCLYSVCATLFWFAPRFTRVFHVVPFTIGQIKKLAIYRCIIFIGAVMLVVGIFLALALIFSWDWNPGFGMWYFCYIEFYFVMMKERLAGFHEKKHKVNIWLRIWTVIIMVASFMLTLGIAEDLPLYVQYLIQIGLFLVYLPYPAAILKNMDFHDYCQVKDSIGGRPSFLE